MSGETEKAVSGWTTDTLKEYFLAQIENLKILLDERDASGAVALAAALLSQEKAVAAALAAAEKAVTKAEVATDKRIEGINELRKVVQDVSALQMPRSEAESRLASLAEKIDELRTGATSSVARGAGLTAGWNYLIGAAGIAAAVAAIVSR